MSARDRQLRKMIIRSFSDKNFQNEDPSRNFTVPINPESFTKNYKVEHDTRRSHGNRGSSAGFKSTAPEELRLEFVLDGTATLEGYGGENTTFKKKPVHDQLQEFLNCVYNMDGEIHRPRFLIVFWGSEVNFPSVLSNLDINHTLFDPDGKPLRLKITATFLNYVARERRLAEERRSSPDLTHYRKLKQSDRLDILSHDFYNSPTYLLQVASVNSLSRIRNIQVGTDLYFPPFDKNEK
jgi:hypothetical protein